MRTDAIILHTRPWHERDLLVHTYTAQAGALVAIAKGALRDGSVQGMHVIQGNILRFDLVAGKGMPIITGAYTLNAFPHIRNNIARQAAMWSLLESVNLLVSDPERDERLWNTLTAALRTLDSCGMGNILKELRNTQREMLGILGYAPHVSTCGVCGTSANGEASSFSVELGSLVCARCTRSGWHGVLLPEHDRLWLAQKRSEAPCTERSERAPTERLMEYISGKRLRSLDLLFGAVKS